MEVCEEPLVGSTSFVAPWYVFGPNLCTWAFVLLVVAFVPRVCIRIFGSDCGLQWTLSSKREGIEGCPSLLRNLFVSLYVGALARPTIFPSRSQKVLDFGPCNFFLLDFMHNYLLSLSQSTYTRLCPFRPIDGVAVKIMCAGNVPNQRDSVFPNMSSLVFNAANSLTPLLLC